jgi:hypothetical protein
METKKEIDGWQTTYHTKVENIFHVQRNEFRCYKIGRSYGTIKHKD